MNKRIKRLREESINIKPYISSERARLITEFYKSDKAYHVSIPVQRAMAFKYVMENKKIHINKGELIVGERGPGPKATPTYPEIARQARVEGVVIIEATTDIYGRVQNVKVLKSIPLLDQSAVDAVRQWVYEPMVINGRPRGVIFVVTVRFNLK